MSTVTVGVLILAMLKCGTSLMVKKDTPVEIEFKWSFTTNLVNGATQIDVKVGGQAVTGGTTATMGPLKCGATYTTKMVQESECNSAFNGGTGGNVWNANGDKTQGPTVCFGFFRAATTAHGHDSNPVVLWKKVDHDAIELSGSADGFSMYPTTAFNKWAGRAPVWINTNHAHQASAGWNGGDLKVPTDLGGSKLMLTVWGDPVVANNRKIAASAAFDIANDCPSAKGDPHVTNIRGDKFDVLKSGQRVMVKYPREGSDPSLVVTADVVRADAKWCENTFIERVKAQGSFLGATVAFSLGKLRSPGPFRVTIDENSMSHDAVVNQGQVALPAHGSFISGSTKQMTLVAGGVSIKVRLVKHSHFQFFNLDVSGLSNLPGEVGGLLGLDDHSGEAHSDCKWKTHKTVLKADDAEDDLSSLVTAT